MARHGRHGPLSTLLLCVRTMQPSLSAAILYISFCRLLDSTRTTVVARRPLQGRAEGQPVFFCFRSLLLPPSCPVVHSHRRPHVFPLPEICIFYQSSDFTQRQKVPLWNLLQSSALFIRKSTTYVSFISKCKC